MTRTSPFAESLFSRIRLDLACGIGLLTRLPINGLLSARQRAQSGPWPLARSLWCWPLVGGGVGAFTGSMAWGLEALHVAALPAAGLALAAQSALTGAFHEDGLADMADSYGTHARERKLEIMRDSRIGSYGVLALCLSLLVRAGAIAALPAPALVGGLALAGLLSRATLLWLPRLLPPARPDGLARSLSPLPRGAFTVAQSFAFLLAALLMTILINGASQQPVLPENQPLFWRLAPALGLVISAAGLAGWLVARSARKHLAGYTGDVLGAAATVADCLVLAALTVLFHN